jgi:hypothetical protein
MSNIFETAIQCMDAAYESSPVDMLDNSEILSQVDQLLMEFREKWEIPNKTEIGYADAIESNWDKWSKAYNDLEIEIFNLCWGHMKVLMLDCGAGDVAREVMASELFDIQTPFDVREQVKKELKSSK